MSARAPEWSGGYREAHSALNWPLLTCGLFGPTAGVAICVVLGITVSPQWFPFVLFVLFVPFVLFGLFLIPISLLGRNWPTGIRVDESGISIGAIGSAQAGMTYCNIGVLASPFMRAALVIEVNPSAVTAGEIRPARYYSDFKDGHFSHLIHPQLSPAWVVPTRHPEALSAALQRVPGDRDVANGL